MAAAKEIKPQTAKTKFGRMTVSRFPRNFCVASLLLLCAFNWTNLFEGLDNGWVDTMFIIRGAEAADPRVSVIAIDDDSVRQVGVFPWPRTVYKKLIEKLLARGVKVVGLDIMFFEPSGNAAADAALIEVTRKHPKNIVHSVANDTGILNRTEIMWPFEALRKVTKAFGFVGQIWIDGDGGVRFTASAIAPSHDMATWNPAELTPSLGVASLMLLEGKPMPHYLGAGYKVRLNWRGNRTTTIKTQAGTYEDKIEPMIPQIPAHRILNGDKLAPEEEAALKDGVALVASTTLGNYDHYPSPFSNNTPGVLVHANLIDNLLNDRHLRIINYKWTFLTVAVMVGLAYLISTLAPFKAILLFFAGLSGWIALNYVLFLNLHILEFVAPLLGYVLPFIALMLHKAIEENRKAAEVRQMFGQYVAPEVVDILVKNPDKLSLGGEKRDMTMFFLDIAHFTTISEKMTPEALIQFLNTYLTALTDDILANNGVVDKYIGDCVMAFWNAPLEEPDHRRKACLAAVACVKTIERLNREYKDPTMPETPAVRIGLNSGEVVVGNTGSARKLAYTVLGDEVNLASRLEGANKFFGSTLMASEDTYNGARDAVEGRLLGSVRVVGKNEPIKVFELLAKKGELDAGWAKGLPLYHEGVALWETRKWEPAKALFDQVLVLVPGDKTTKHYLSTCEDYIAIEPPKEWEPVFNLTSK
ncbi:MAG: adenylate/guanylate cyclase domain-containing protein [Elusimicrobia bacterium]|nr:adenylate/guanylate cyclase domain-containing protein [Elusimicrobiota bacterium]